jgi:acetyl esterase/lipase
MWTRGLLSTLLALMASSAAAAIGPDPIPLWPEGPPGGGSEGLSVLRAYPAPADRATGTAVVVCPGGGYRLHATDHEGQQVAKWLNRIGVSAFVLHYRLGAQHPHPAPLQDAQRALRHVRAHAGALGVAPDRIGILGFSAGGHLASTAATHFDAGDPAAADPVERVSSRPDFAILGYPVISLSEPFRHDGSRRNLLGARADDPELVEALSSEKQVTAETPPSFLFHTGEDDGVPVENSLAFYAALRGAGVPAELHIYQLGPHGVGLAPGDPVLGSWTERLADWLRTTGKLTGAERFAVSGRVLVGGAPLVLGTVSFEPEDPHAPIAWAPVRNGEFQVPNARGPVAGPHRVVVRDLGDVGPVPTIEDLRVLPAIRRELPPGGGELVLELPDEAP